MHWSKLAFDIWVEMALGFNVAMAFLIFFFWVLVVLEYLRMARKIDSFYQTFWFLRSMPTATQQNDPHFKRIMSDF